jgi:hypothetical protein
MKAVLFAAVAALALGGPISTAHAQAPEGNPGPGMDRDGSVSGNRAPGSPGASNANQADGANGSIGASSAGAGGSSMSGLGPSPGGPVTGTGVGAGGGTAGGQ